MAKIDNRQSDEYIWEWYKRFEMMKEKGITLPKYCKDNNIPLTEGRSISWRIIYRTKNILAYDKLINIAKEYDPKACTLKEYARMKGISTHQLNETNSHIRALEVIERMKRKHGEMTFIPVSTAGNIMLSNPTPEVMPKQNDIELIIDAGVRVMVSPQVGTERLIKIIELLKDL